MRPALLLASFAIALPATAQFTIQTSNTTADLRGIHNVGNGVAWASGTHGTVLRTEDGGYVWQSCSVPPGGEKLDFRGVQAFDANTAIVMSSGPGDQSRLYKTTDGCHTWKLLFTNPDKDGFWDCLWLHRTGHGILLGDPVDSRFALFETSDGGVNWIRDKSDGLKFEGKPIAAFAASNSLFAQTSTGYSRAFATGGPGGAFLYEAWNTEKKWSRAKIPVASGTDSSGVFSLGMRYSGSMCSHCEKAPPRFVAVGGDYQKPEEAAGTSAFSNDGGYQWQYSQTQPHGYRSSVAYDEQNKTWITVGPNGTDISTDDGRNWLPVRPSASLHEPEDADRNWNALSLPYVVGPKGRIGRLDSASLKLKTGK
ncbi:MAG: hypothetical protein JST28_21870 [Acidobacteria bacterium]|nr:hypothetical protein [Acidobacteriota bacterium]